MTRSRITRQTSARGNALARSIGLPDRPVKVQTVPDSLDDTLAWICSTIHTLGRSPLWNGIARRIAADAWRNAGNNEEREIAYMRCVWRWIVQNIGYTQDPWSVVDSRHIELLADPEALVRFGIGDCEEHVPLTATLLVSLGRPVDLWICGPGKRMRHIFLCAYTTRKTQVPIDTTLTWSPFGTVPGEPSWNYRRISL